MDAVSWSVTVGNIKLYRRTHDDNDKIYAVIRGLGSSSDGAGDAVYAPQSSGQKKALKRAYEQAGFSPSTVELVEVVTRRRCTDRVSQHGCGLLFS